jgi:hypothetical protein
MFCPQCKAEYRPGFTRCADCDLDLVDQLPLPAEPSSQPLEVVWSGQDQQECVFWCQTLKAAGILFTVNQRRTQIWGTGMNAPYEIAVLGDFAARSKSEIARQRWPPQGEEEQLRLIGLPESDEDPPPPPEHRDFKPWFPEDATVEIFSESTDKEEEKKAWMVEISLRENLIHSRTDELGDGSRKIFVLPEDEARAREIVHEVTTASPPA